MSIDLNLEPLEATLGAGALIVNDYRITTEPIDGGHRITVTRGSETQTMDVLDGVGIVGIEKTGSTGDMDSYRVSFTDGSTFEYTVETNAATYAAAEAARVEAENSRVRAEAERVSAEAGRVNAESVRVVAENARAAAETARANAENERAGAETLRAAAETERANAESGRVSAEQGRVSAESERVAAEEARATEFAGFSGEITQLKDDLSAEQTAREQADTSMQQEISAKLPKSPADWEAWTAEEQAAARENISAASAGDVDALKDDMNRKIASVNGAVPDENGNVEIEIPEGFNGNYEEFVFTLEDGTTVTKKVLVAE